MKKLLVLGIAGLFLFGCSEFIYDSAQHYNEKQCRKLPPHQYDRCIDENKQSYRDYQAERQALLEEPQEPKLEGK